MELEPITESADGMASLVDTITSDPVTTYPWYASDWVVRGLSAYIALNAMYFIFRYFKGGNGNDGGPTGGSGSGIAPDNGLLGLLPPKEERDTTYDDIHWWGCQEGRFAANARYGESSDRLFCAILQDLLSKMYKNLSFVQTIRKIPANSLRRIVCCSRSPCPRSPCLRVLLLFLILSCLPKHNSLSKSSIRKYILLTLSHVDFTEARHNLSSSVIISRLTKAFACKSIVISKEHHVSRGGTHYHIGVWNETVSKYTGPSLLRDMFPEFEGRQLNVSFHKGWNTVCNYCLKEDQDPVVWGEEPLEMVKKRAKSAETKRRGPDLVKLLRDKNSWEEVMADDSLVKKCLSSYSSVRSTFEDLQAMKKNPAGAIVLICP
jgi:hypothetical protein